MKRLLVAAMAALGTEVLRVCQVSPLAWFGMRADVEAELGSCAEADPESESWLLGVCETACSARDDLFFTEEATNAIRSAAKNLRQALATFLGMQDNDDLGALFRLAEMKADERKLQQADLKTKSEAHGKEIDALGNEIDPRQELIDKILEYKRFKEASVQMAEMEVVRMQMIKRGECTT